MRYATLAELPPPAHDKSSWPWTEESPQLPETRPDGSPWPRISIVTPSYNQGQFIEETIRSVLLQGYPNLEYIIIDGSSTDGSVEIIKKYEPWLSFWVSEKDRGQSNAINKGFALASGEIMAWINSDDLYEHGAFATVVSTFAISKNLLWLAGACEKIDDKGLPLGKSTKPVTDINAWLVTSLVRQPAVFWKRTIWEKCGQLDETLQYSFDYDLWLRFLRVQFLFGWCSTNLAYFRFHSESKTAKKRSQFESEDAIVFDRHRSFIRSKKELERIVYLRKRNLILNHMNREKSITKSIMETAKSLATTPLLIFDRKLYSILKRKLFTAARDNR